MSNVKERMHSYDSLSQRTRSFRKGVLTFSAFLALTISFQVAVTKIPALGIEDINPEIVFTGNAIALAYLTFSFIIYYLQDQVHFEKSNPNLKTRDIEKSSKYIESINNLINEFFGESIANIDADEDFQKGKKSLTRILMKGDYDDESVKNGADLVIKNLLNEKKLYKPSDNLVTDLANERRNYLDNKAHNLMKLAKQRTIDSIVGILDLWVPLMSSVFAFLLYILKLKGI